MKAQALINERSISWADLQQLLKGLNLFQERDPVLTKEFRLTVPREIRRSLPTIIGLNWTISLFAANDECPHLVAVPSHLFDTYLASSKLPDAVANHVSAVSNRTALDKNNRWFITSTLAQGAQLAIGNPCVIKPNNGVIEIWDKGVWRDRQSTPIKSPPHPVQSQTNKTRSSETSNAKPKSKLAVKTKFDLMKPAGGTFVSAARERKIVRPILGRLYNTEFLQSLITNEDYIRRLSVTEYAILICVGFYKGMNFDVPNSDVLSDSTTMMYLLQENPEKLIDRALDQLKGWSPSDRKRLVREVLGFLKNKPGLQKRMFTIAAKNINSARGIAYQRMLFGGD